MSATRRNERLQDVPISITALDADALVRKQVVDVINLAKVTPGLQVKTTFTPLEITSTIRGVTQVIPSINSDPPIGTYVDGVYNALNAGSNTAFIDMERVEVLKGPQGTLFGRNTIGGAISVVTAKPEDSFGGYVQGDIGNYGAWTGTAVVNLPVSPGVLDTRLVYQHTEHDGYGDNLTTGNPTGTFNQDYGRLVIHARPADGWDLLVSGYYVNAQGYGPATRLGFVNTSAAVVPALGPTNTAIPALSGVRGDALSNYVDRGGFQDSSAGLDNRFKLEQYGATGTLTHEVGEEVTLKAIGGFIHTDYTTTTGLGGTPYVTVNLLDFPISADQFSLELQAFGKALDDRLDWIVGAYGFSEKGSQVGTTVSLPAISQAFGQPVTQTVSGPEVLNRSYSTFAQLTYEVAPDLRLTGGVRYVVDKRRTEYADHSELAGSLPGPYRTCSLANAPFATDPDACLFRRAVKYDYAPWTIGVDYKVSPDTLLYAKLSKGYRSGAFLSSGPAAVAPSATVSAAQAASQTALNLATFAPAAPENLLSPEAGLKIEAFDRRLRLNLAAYYSWYKNVQVSTRGTAACLTCAPPGILLNSGRVEIWGGEAEAGLNLGAFSIDAVAGYTKPRYVAGLVGYPVLNVSKFNGSITGSYKADLPLGALTLSSTYSHRSKATLALPTPGQPEGWTESLEQEGFGLWDARMSITPANSRFTLSIYGQNLSNRKFITSAAAFAPPLGYTLNWPGAPRTYGASLKASF